MTQTKSRNSKVCYTVSGVSAALGGWGLHYSRSGVSVFIESGGSVTLGVGVCGTQRVVVLLSSCLLYLSRNQ